MATSSTSGPLAASATSMAATGPICSLQLSMAGSGLAHQLASPLPTAPVAGEVAGPGPEDLEDLNQITASSQKPAPTSLVLLSSTTSTTMA